MRLEPRDEACLWDILDAASQLESFVGGMSLSAFERDRLRQRAAERLLEIIGEASRRLSDDCRQSHPEIPWSSIIGLRNVLAHEYGEIRQDIIWRVATERVPSLASALQKTLGNLDA